MRSYSGDSPEDAMKVTRSIMIMKPAGYQSNGSAPASPAGSTPPVSPFSGKVLSIIKCLIRPWLSGSYVECVLSE